MRESRAAQFEVRYPWGESYCEQLRANFDRMGFTTADHPQLDGDSVGFLVAENREQILAGLALIEQESPAMDDTEDEEWFEMFLNLVAQLLELGVYVVEYDWRHFEWTGAPFEDLGVDLKLISESVVDNEQRYLFEISRAIETSR